MGCDRINSKLNDICRSCTTKTVRDRGRRNKEEKLFFQANKRQNQVYRGDRITQVMQMHINIIRIEKKKKKCSRREEENKILSSQMF